ncbi:MAG: hypothetical protein J5604_06530 [Bacteroidales bacterium]|nr:hypothetical protein [Bacteroidales bacterium]
MIINDFKNRIFGIKSVEEFNALALQAFEYQRENCAVYRQYLELTGRLNLTPKSPFEIPFLPIRLFKTQDIVTPLSTSSQKIQSTCSSCTTTAPSAEGVPVLRTPQAKKAQNAQGVPVFRTPQAPNTSSSVPGVPDFRTLGTKKAQNVPGVPIFRTPGTPITFTSSATTGMVPSHHIVQDISIYEQSFRSAFHHFYGEDFNLLALLPSYLEREGSSLVYMADSLIKEAQQKGNTGGFFLYNHSELLNTLQALSSGIQENNSEGRKTILLGVSFALLDFAAFIKEQIPNKDERRAIFKDVIIMETGGMKGRGKELSRSELHSTLSEAFATSAIHSEYGMCELLSQAYSFPINNGNTKVAATDNKAHIQQNDISVTGIFFTPPWMQVLLRDLQDPFKILSAAPNKVSAKTLSGGINIIDLANIGSCCFIETEDRGTLYPSAITAAYSIHPPFTVDSRIKNSELRGCNMLIE